MVSKKNSGEYPVMYCDSTFQEQFSYLDKGLIGKHKMLDWEPYHWNGVRQESYAIDTGYVLPILEKTGTPTSRQFFYIKPLFEICRLLLVRR